MQAPLSPESLLSGNSQVFRQPNDAKKGTVHGTSVMKLPKQQLIDAHHPGVVRGDIQPCWAGQACWPPLAGVSSHALVALENRVIQVRDLLYKMH